jgi:hypothetical protein
MFAVKTGGAMHLSKCSILGGYMQILDVGKACQGQTLQPITNIRKLPKKKFYKFCLRVVKNFFYSESHFVRYRINT